MRLDRQSRTHAVLLLAMLAAASLAGCVTGGEVERTTAELFKKLEAMKEPGYVCAPKPMANAAAHAYFARTESDFGDTMKARAHLEAAQRWYDVAYRETHTPDNAVREGCEGDRDDDGVLDSKDKCPEDPEDFDGDQDHDGCPEWDRDGDGIPDDKDQCPADPEDWDGFEDNDGCPDLDNDLDGIPDKTDKCPNQPEDFDGFEDKDGCPEPDNDKDGIPDVKDQCPNEAETFNEHEDADGCPDVVPNVIVTEDRIELKQKIFFKTNKATIMSISFELLDEVAEALKKRSEIKVRIEGHTDDVGNDKANLKLSDARAKAVRDFLIKRGIAADRMIALGYGESRPIEDNATEEGRDRNRRVEFNIIKE